MMMVFFSCERHFELSIIYFKVSIIPFKVSIINFKLSIIHFEVDTLGCIIDSLKCIIDSLKCLFHSLNCIIDTLKWVINTSKRGKNKRNLKLKNIVLAVNTWCVFRGHLVLTNEIALCTGIGGGYIVAGSVLVPDSGHFLAAALEVKSKFHL